MPIHMFFFCLGGACCSLRYAPVHISELGLDHSGVGIAKQLKRILETWAHLLNQPGETLQFLKLLDFV